MMNSPITLNVYDMRKLFFLINLFILSWSCPELLSQSLSLKFLSLDATSNPLTWTMKVPINGDTYSSYSIEDRSYNPLLGFEFSRGYYYAATINNNEPHQVLVTIVNSKGVQKDVSLDLGNKIYPPTNLFGVYSKRFTVDESGSMYLLYATPPSSSGVSGRQVLEKFDSTGARVWQRTPDGETEPGYSRLYKAANGVYGLNDAPSFKNYYRLYFHNSSNNPDYSYHFIDGEVSLNTKDTHIPQQFNSVGLQLTPDNLYQLTHEGDRFKIFDSGDKSSPRILKLPLKEIIDYWRYTIDPVTSNLFLSVRTKVRKDSELTKRNKKKQHYSSYIFMVTKNGEVVEKLTIYENVLEQKAIAFPRWANEELMIYQLGQYFVLVDHSLTEIDRFDSGLSYSEFSTGKGKYYKGDNIEAGHFDSTGFFVELNQALYVKVDVIHDK